MSRIDELVAELAPRGVRHVALSEVAVYSSSRVDAKDLDETSFVGVDNLVAGKGGRIDASYLPNTARLTAYELGDILLGNIRPYLKKVWRATGSGGCSGDVLSVRIKAGSKQDLDSEFLYYLLSSDGFFAYNMQHAKGAKMPRGSKTAIMSFRIPVPPLEVQREIVRTLDQFTQLEAELEAELEARRRQYLYYAGLLLTNNDEVSRVRFGDVATIVRGASPRPIQNFITEAAAGVPWIKIGDVPARGKYITQTAQRVTAEGAKKSRRVRPGDFVLSNSMSFGRPYISKIDGYIHDGWLAISGFEDAFVSDYLYYLLRSSPVQDEFARRAGSGTVKNLNAEIVRSVEIPLPPKETQRRVVELLDKFDALVNDLSIGLPAELDARRKQYEHYRDRLLTFEEAAA
ncbi:restriction endonuclease subunit S [Microbacterium lacus]|uniref:restriction endonuclease subunit S n=1 Tax=Microbacterium lacus TaxID=415217 RepID=UPI001E3A692C|nr:restriction endonuclease subunit S [Microbacterium lacus]